jgi:hypothetical protein
MIENEMANFEKRPSRRESSCAYPMLCSILTSSSTPASLPGADVGFIALFLCGFVGSFFSVQTLPPLFIR